MHRRAIGRSRVAGPYRPSHDTTKAAEQEKLMDTAKPIPGMRIVGAERVTWTKDCLRRYNAGESIREIASSTGRSYGFVHRILVEGGATLRARGGARHRRPG